MSFLVVDGDQSVRVNLVAAVNPAVPTASGVRSYVLTLARKLVSLDVEVCVLGWGGRQEGNHGFDFVSVADRAPTAYGYTLALARFVRRQGVEGLVHGNRPDDLLPFHLGASAPTILTLHGVHGFHVRAKRGRLSASAYHLAERRALERAKAILCISPTTLEHYVLKYPRISSLLRMIPAGVDMDLFRLRSREQARTRLRFSEEWKLVTFVGRFEPEKNPLAIMREFLAMAHKHRDAHLVMVGAGRLEGQIRQFASQAPSRTSVLPPMNQAELAWLLNASDILVVGSQHEGLPTVAIEALASGIPVVATPVGILPDLISSGSNGLLAGNSSSLGPLIEKALFDVNWDQTTVRASAQKFGWDCVAPAILEVYRAISA